MERGQSLDSVRISLLNAGYSQQDVQNAINEVQNAPKQMQISIPSKTGSTKTAIPLSSIPPPPIQTQKPKISQKKQKNFVFVILVVFIMLVISGALTIGIFFEQIKNAILG